MIRRKPQPGTCGVCGCAVVQPGEQEKWAAVGEVVHGGSWSKPIAESGWVNSHEYASDGTLFKVRCPQDGGLGFPSGPVGDATVPQ
jgi:hypothetical protein